MQATGQASTQSATPSQTLVTIVWAIGTDRRQPEILGRKPDGAAAAPLARQPLRLLPVGAGTGAEFGGLARAVQFPHPAEGQGEPGGGGAGHQPGARGLSIP